MQPMNNQPTLFEIDTEAEKKFKAFDEKNPRVYDELVRLTLQAHEKGRTKIGIKMLIEVVRWNRFIRTTDGDFKINNNYAPRYARKIMSTYPELGDIFNTRDLRK